MLRIAAVMVRLLGLALALACAAMVALVLGSIASDEGVSLATIRIDALSTAGVIIAAVAAGSLLRRKR